MEYDNFDDQKERRFSRHTTFLYVALAFVMGMIVAIWLLSSRVFTVRHDANDKFNEVLTYLEELYVDSVNTDELTEEAINLMLQKLDPHSVYSNAKENQETMEMLEGEFEGVGIQFSIMHDTVMVIATISGGPAAQAGIQAGDRIIAVGDSVISGVNIQNNDVMNLIRGPKNSKVTLAIQRPGFKKTYHFDIVRDKIPTYTIDVAYMLDAKTGYIKINQFGLKTGDEFSAALNKLKRKGMQKLVLDLRENPGGYLESCIQVCDELLPAGEMIVYTEGLHSKKEEVWARRGGLFEQGTLVVLIDDFSASASEIVAGAVQDNDRGTIIGRRSFGKGLVQRQIDFSDHSSVRLTVARYHTPSGRCIQKDYTEGSDSYNLELLDRYMRGEMNSRDSVKENKTLKFKTKKGRTVYGGGGIMPDIFIPLNQDSLLRQCYDVLNTGKGYSFAFDYVTKNKKMLQQRYPTAEIFVQKMTVDETIFNEFKRYYSQENGEKLPAMSAKAQKELKLWLKSCIGRDLYQDEAFYPVIHQSDATIAAAKKVK